MEVTYMKMEERDRLIREDGIIQGQTAAIQLFIDAHRKKGSTEDEILSLIQEFFQLSSDTAESLLKNK